MGQILNRYIFRETALTWFAVTGVLLLILLTDQFARVLDDAAGAQLPKKAIFAVMGLSSIQYMTILIPVGIFIAIMLAFAVPADAGPFRGEHFYGSACIPNIGR